MESSLQKGPEFSDDFSPPRARNDVLVPALLIGLCALPIFAALSPRFLAFAPGLIAITGAALFRKNYKHWPALNQTFTVLALFTIVMCAASASWSFDASKTLERTLRVALVLLPGALFFALPGALSTLDFSRLARGVFRFFPLVMIGAGLIIVLDLFAGGLLYNIARENTEEMNYSRINRSVIAFTFMLLPTLWMLWQARLKHTKKTTLIAAALCGITALIFYGTESQSAQMALGIAAIIFVAFPVRWRAAWVALGLFIIIAMSFAPWIATWMFDALAANAKTVPWISRGYAAERMEIWDFIARKIFENPIYGFGLEAARDIEHFETKNLYNPVDHVLHPHNFILQIWIEFGALGIAFVSALYAVILKAIYEQPEMLRRFLLALFLALSAVAATTYGLWQAWWLGVFIVIAALCAFITRAYKENHA
jgi:O-antigen ligase